MYLHEIEFEEIKKKKKRKDNNNKKCKILHVLIEVTKQLGQS